VKSQHQQRKGSTVQYGDKRRMAQSSYMKDGDLVLIQQKHQHKLDTTFKPQLYTVISRKGAEVTVQFSDGVEYRRNVAHLKKYVYCAPDPYSDIIDTKSDESSKSPKPPAEEPGNVDTSLDNDVLVMPPQPEVADPSLNDAVPSQQQQYSHQHSAAVRHSARVRQRSNHLRDYVSSV